MDMKIKTILLLISFLTPSAFAANTTCPLSNGINVHTALKRLTICKQGTAVKSFSVALGFNGIGKKHAGDNKTPIGLYRLAYPRKSSKFKVFIPIQYPTAKQIASGYSGRDVGIHGPDQSKGILNWLSHLPYSTRGCVAVGKNNYIEYVANWVKANPGTKILII